MNKFVILFFVFSYALISGCDNQRSGVDQRSQKQSIPTNKILSNDDTFAIQKSPQANDFRKVATYTDVGGDSGVFIDELKITDSGVYATMRSTGGNEKTLYKSERYCANHMNGGLFTLFQDVCTRWERSEYKTKIKSGNKVAVATISNDASLSSGGTKISFIGDSFFGANSISFEGVDFTTAQLQLSMPEEEKQDLEKIKLYIEKNNLNIRKLALLANRFKESPSSASYISSKLRDELKQLSSISAYSVALVTLNKDTMGSLEISDDFVGQVYTDEIKPLNSPEANAKFIDKYKAASGIILNRIYSDAVDFKKREIENAVKNEAYSGVTGKLKQLIGYEGNAKEVVVRKIHSEAIRAKDSGNTTLYAVIIKSIMTSELLVGADALYSLERDKEMKEFLGEQFGKLISSNKEISSEVINGIRDLGVIINNKLSSIEGALDKPLDLTVEREATQRFLIQSHQFDLANKRI